MNTVCLTVTGPVESHTSGDGLYGLTLRCTDTQPMAAPGNVWVVLYHGAKAKSFFAEAGITLDKGDVIEVEISRSQAHYIKTRHFNRLETIAWAKAIQLAEVTA